MLAILWIGDPAGLRGIEDSVLPSLDSERESIRIYASGGSLEAPMAILVEIDVVQEDDDLGRGDERALEVDAHGGGIGGVTQEVAHVLASEKIQIFGCKDEQMTNSIVESGIVPGRDVAISPIFSNRLDR